MNTVYKKHNQKYFNWVVASLVLQTLLTISLLIPTVIFLVDIDMYRLRAFITLLIFTLYFTAGLAWLAILCKKYIVTKEFDIMKHFTFTMIGLPTIFSFSIILWMWSLVWIVKTKKYAIEQES